MTFMRYLLPLDRVQVQVEAGLKEVKMKVDV